MLKGLNLQKKKTSPLLKPMSEQDFEEYKSYTINHYAMEKVKAGLWTVAEAMEKAEEQFQRLLPNGLNSTNHYLWSIVNEEKDVMGWLWVYIDREHPLKDAFIYDIGLYEAYQGQGIGKWVLKTLEEEAEELGVKKLSLHVFAHNKTAIRLYEKMNYEVTDLHMSKRL
ncbi:GNAT family N-acetyltransferase [Bacillus sp. CLL-7-23]|uniref:GNAT family N-acetyltransferase n=1 Tax=Bacillus changyiensis TaxID=3004103 RepID=A0ABT4WYG6_9BACI|nr:GNAT family N-acetyltransferase [Bacillus changyiensis]MDA7025089.1 GNAT family N-acetyltransferase [Bacillus changyiensis]